MSIDHHNEAILNPSAYSGTVETMHGGILSVADAANFIGDIFPIVQRFGSWVVCNDGSIQSLYTTYYIANSRLREPGWVNHLAEKTWVDIYDFQQALAYALEFYS